MNHTPTPWKVHYNRDTVNVRNTDGQRICTIDTMMDGQEATAAFIVRTCNSHDALVTTLEALLDEISGCGLVFKGYIDADSVKTAKTALKLAKCE